MAVNCTYGDAFISEEEEEGGGGGACSSFSGVLSYCLLRI